MADSGGSCFGGPVPIAITGLPLVDGREGERLTIGSSVLDAVEVGQLQPMIRQALVHVLEDMERVDDLMAFRHMKAKGPRG